MFRKLFNLFKMDDPNKELDHFWLYNDNDDTAEAKELPTGEWIIFYHSDNTYMDGFWSIEEVEDEMVANGYHRTIENM